MWVGFREVAPRWLGPEVVGSAAGWLLWSRMQARAGRLRRERKVQEELEAYAELDVRLASQEDVRELAGRVSQMMVERSPFVRTAMLVRDAEGRLVVAASSRMDEATAKLLGAWGKDVAAVEPGGVGGGVRREGCDESKLGVRVGRQSYGVVLGTSPEEREHQQAIVVPLWTMGGRLLGALAVGADGLMSVRRSALARALEPLEALAVKVARSMENATLAERLLRAEKLAGLGMMAGGMAHALNNPLTAVLGFAELIANTTGEARVKVDAEIIVSEALRIRQTVETLLEFWRPALLNNELVQVMELVWTLAAECEQKLESRGVRLVVQAGENEPSVRGNRYRLRQVLEHLLNNAAQALAQTVIQKGAENAGGERVIRVSVSHDVEALHVVVSDTGPGFSDPARVFDPFYATGEAGGGLSICYRIVHEHGGEISAFNLQPHGAAVGFELPLEGAARKKSKAARTEVAVV